MKSGCCLLAALAFGALSMDSAAAAHRNHGAGGVGSHRHSSAGSSNHAKSVASGTPRTPSSESTGAVTDHSPGAGTDHSRNGGAKEGGPLAGTDKASGNEERHPGKSEKTGAATQDHGAGSKQDLDLAVNTRITVHHGHETNGSLKNHPFKSANLRAATEGLTHQHPGDHRWAPQVRSSEDRRRNAIGVTLGHEQTIEHRNAVGVAVVPSSGAGAAPKTDSSPPAPGALIHDPNAGRPTGNTPANASVPGAISGSRGTGAAAPAIATTNGSSVGGTGLIRPVSRTAAIGGPAKVALGVVSGNSIRLKHP